MAQALALALPLVACFAGCGGDDGGGARPGRVDVAGARKEIERFKAIPSFKAPGPAFDATRKLRGKKIFEIPITSEVPFVSAVERGMTQAAAEVGARLVVYRNQGRPSQWAQGVRTAIAQRADAITLLAQDPSLLGPQIAQAEKAGTPVIVLRSSGEGQECPSRPDGKPYGTTCIPGPFERAGRLEADWVVAKTNGKVNALAVTSNDAPSTASLVRGLKDELRTRCPGCNVRYVDVPIPSWAEQIRTEVQSALVRDPRINYVIPIYDSMSQFVVPAIKAAGAAARVKIAAFNGTPFVLKMQQDENIVQMDAGENLSWVGWASMDQAFRVIAETNPVKSENTPLRVFDDTNVADTGRPPRFDRGYGNSYVDGYRRLWGATD